MKNRNNNHTLKILFKIPKIILLLVFFSCQNSFAQKSGKGNYFFANPWVISFIKLKNSGKVKWHNSSCTSEHKVLFGTWSRSGDTIIIDTEEHTRKFIVEKKHLCFLEDDGRKTPHERALRKTLTKTWIGISKKANRMQARRQKN